MSIIPTGECQKDKIEWYKVSIGQGEDFGDHPCGVCRKRGMEFVITQSYAWSVLGYIQIGCVAFFRCE